MDYMNKTKKELVMMINDLPGPKVTIRPRKATLIEILEDRLDELHRLNEVKMPADNCADCDCTDCACEECDCADDEPTGPVCESKIACMIPCIIIPLLGFASVVGIVYFIVSWLMS